MPVLIEVEAPRQCEDVCVRSNTDGRGCQTSVLMLEMQDTCDPLLRNKRHVWNGGKTRADHHENCRGAMPCSVREMPALSPGFHLSSLTCTGAVDSDVLFGISQVLHPLQAIMILLTWCAEDMRCCLLDVAVA